MSDATHLTPERYVTLSISEHVADVRLNRPDKHNGIDWKMIDALLAVQQELHARARESGLRAIVLSGEGPSFCAGLDIAAIMGDAARVPPRAWLWRASGRSFAAQKRGGGGGR